MSASSVRLRVTLSDPSHKLALVLAIAGAALAALFVTTPWVVAILASLVILILSAIENEPFLLLMIFLMPVHSLAMENTPELMSMARVLLVVGFFLGRIWRGQVKIKRLLEPLISRASLLFAAAAFISALLGTGGLTRASAVGCARLISYLGFYFFVLSWVDSRQRMRRAALTLLAGTIMVALFAIYQEIVGDYTSLWLYLKPAGQLFDRWDGRATSFIGTPNGLAFYLNLILPFCLACSVLTKNGTWKRTGIWALGLGGIALAFTQSRGGLVAFGCVLILAVFWFVQKWWKRVSLLGGFASLVVGFLFFGRILNPEHLGNIEDATAASRLLLWGTAWSFFTQSPLLGVGWGNFEQLYGEFIKLDWIPSEGLWVHNLYLQLLSETGLLGFITFFAMIGFAIREALRQLRTSIDSFHLSVAFGVLGGIVTIAAHGFVDTVIGAQIPYLLWMLLALLVVNARLCPSGCDSQLPAARMALPRDSR